MFWWQQRPQDAKFGHRHSNKRALFPVHVLEYSDNGTKASSKTSHSSEAPLAAAAEYQSSSKETSHLQSKGEERHILPDMLIMAQLRAQKTELSSS